MSFRHDHRFFEGRNALSWLFGKMILKVMAAPIFTRRQSFQPTMHTFEVLQNVPARVPAVSSAAVFGATRFLRAPSALVKLRNFGLLAVAMGLSGLAARADYVGNPLASGNPDGDPPVAILGEYGGSTTAPPGASSTLSFPTNGTVSDIQIYNANPGTNFAIYTIRPAGTNSNGNQLFTFVNGQSFISGATPGPETFSPSNTWQVQKGDLIVYWGYVAPYSYGSFNDATYENDGVYTATLPAVGQTYSFGVNTSSTANYKYIANYGPGRVYSVGIDYTPFTGPATSVPVVTNLPASNIQAMTATLNGQILATGGGPPPVVTVYYGPADGGTNAAAWTNNIPWGPQTGPFSVTATGLATNTVYYFTASASNALGVAWAAPSQTFTTLSNSTLISVLTYHYDNTGRARTRMNSCSPPRTSTPAILANSSLIPWMVISTANHW